MKRNNIAREVLEEMVGEKALQTFPLEDCVSMVADDKFVIEAMEKYAEAKAGQNETLDIALLRTV